MVTCFGNRGSVTMDARHGFEAQGNEAKVKLKLSMNPEADAVNNAMANLTSLTAHNHTYILKTGTQY